MRIKNNSNHSLRGYFPPKAPMDVPPIHNAIQKKNLYMMLANYCKEALRLTSHASI